MPKSYDCFMFVVFLFCLLFPFGCCWWGVPQTTSFLDPGELVMSGAVCRSWRQVSLQPKLWLAHWRSPLLPALHNVYLNEEAELEQARTPVVAALHHSLQ